MDGLGLSHVDVAKLRPLGVAGRGAVVNVEKVAGHRVLLRQGGSTEKLSGGSALASDCRSAPDGSALLRLPGGALRLRGPRQELRRTRADAAPCGAACSLEPQPHPALLIRAKARAIGKDQHTLFIAVGRNPHRLPEEAHAAICACSKCR